MIRALVVVGLPLMSCGFLNAASQGDLESPFLGSNTNGNNANPQEGEGEPTEGEGEGGEGEGGEGEGEGGEGEGDPDDATLVPGEVITNRCLGQRISITRGPSTVAGTVYPPVDLLDGSARGLALLLPDDLSSDDDYAFLTCHLVDQGLVAITVQRQLGVTPEDYLELVFRVLSQDFAVQADQVGIVAASSAVLEVHRFITITEDHRPRVLINVSGGADFAPSPSEIHEAQNFYPAAALWMASIDDGACGPVPPGCDEYVNLVEQDNAAAQSGWVFRHFPGNLHGTRLVMDGDVNDTPPLGQVASFLIP